MYALCNVTIKYLNNLKVDTPICKSTMNYCDYFIISVGYNFYAVDSLKELTVPL